MPYPGAFTTCAGEKLVIWEADHSTGTQHHALAGQIVRLSEGQIDIATGEGLLHARRWETSKAASLRQHAVLGK